MTITYIAPRVETAREQYQFFSVRGVDGAAADALVSESAMDRHRQRVEAVTRCAEAWAESASPDDDPDLAAAVVFACELIGPRRKRRDHRGTERHPAFAACGKGRRHARDGEAWSVAIVEAACALGDHGVSPDAALRACGTYFVKDGSLCVADDGETLVVNERLAPRAWRLALLAEGLRRAAGREGWHYPLSMIADASTLAAWSDAFNRTSSMRDEDEIVAEKREVDCRPGAVQESDRVRMSAAAMGYEFVEAFEVPRPLEKKAAEALPFEIARNYVACPVSESEVLVSDPLRMDQFVAFRAAGCEATNWRAAEPRTIKQLIREVYGRDPDEPKAIPPL